MWTAGIIGVGRIGAGFDTPDGAEVRTHLKACLAEPRFRLVAVSDRDEARAARVCREWALALEPCSVEALLDCRPDVVCIAASTEAHLALLEKLVAQPPRLVICEKPLGDDTAAATQVVQRLQRAGTIVIVAYQRRWLPPVSGWLKRATSGEFGHPLGAVVHYTGGVRNNASHALDLLCAFFGTAAVGAAAVVDSVRDRGADDPTLTAYFELPLPARHVPVWLHGIDASVLSTFDLELLFTHARLRVENCDGVRARLDLPQRHALAGYAPELRPAEAFHDHPARLLAHLWRNAADVLDGTAAPLCTAADALNVAVLLDSLLQSRAAVRSRLVPA